MAPGLVYAYARWVCAGLQGVPNRKPTQRSASNHGAIRAWVGLGWFVFYLSRERRTGGCGECGGELPATHAPGILPRPEAGKQTHANPQTHRSLW